MKPIKYRPEAEVDIDEGLAYYRRHDPGTEARFLQLVIERVGKIASDPETGFISEADTRTLLLPKFPYGIVFKEYDEYVLIVSVYNWNRQEGGWLERVEDEESMRRSRTNDG